MFYLYFNIVQSYKEFFHVLRSKGDKTDKRFIFIHFCQDVIIFKILKMIVLTNDETLKLVINKKQNFHRFI